MSVLDTIDPMSRPRGDKPDDKSSKGQHRSPSYNLFARIDPKLGKRFEQYLQNAWPKVSKTAAIEAALKFFLDHEESDEDE